MGGRACSLLTIVSPGGRWGLGHPCTLTSWLVNQRLKCRCPENESLDCDDYATAGPYSPPYPDALESASVRIARHGEGAARHRPCSGCPHGRTTWAFSHCR